MSIDENQSIADNLRLKGQEIAMEHSLDSVVLLCTKTSVNSETSTVIKAYVGNHYASIGAMKDEVITQDTYAKRNAWDDSYQGDDE